LYRYGVGHLLRAKAASARAIAGEYPIGDPDDARAHPGHGGPHAPQHQQQQQQQQGSEEEDVDDADAEVLTLLYDMPVGDALHRLSSHNVLSARALQMSTVSLDLKLSTEVLTWSLQCWQDIQQLLSLGAYSGRS
jgi:hypothetical protein